VPPCLPPVDKVTKVDGSKGGIGRVSAEVETRDIGDGQLPIGVGTRTRGQEGTVDGGRVGIGNAAQVALENGSENGGAPGNRLGAILFETWVAVELLTGGVENPLGVARTTLCLMTLVVLGMDDLCRKLVDDAGVRGGNEPLLVGGPGLSLSVEGLYLPVLDELCLILGPREGRTVHFE